MLNGTLTLHDIRDVEAFTHRIIQRQQPDLHLSDREDLHAYLIATCWELSREYDGTTGSRFSAWAKHTLTLRTIDWQRTRYGRTTWRFNGHTHTRTRPTLHQLGHPDTLSAMDATPDRSPDLARILRTRDRPTPPPDDPMAERQARKAA